MSFSFFVLYTAQKMKFPIKDFLSKNLRIWSHLLKKSLMENFIFCAVLDGEINLEWVNRIYLQFFLKYFLRKNTWDWSHYPLSTGRKLNVHKMLGRRSERLYNVLCTLYLRPLCRGT